MTALCLAEYLLRQTAVNNCNCPEDAEHTFIQDSGPGQHRLLQDLSKVIDVKISDFSPPYSLLLHRHVGGLQSMFGVGEASPTAKVGQLNLSLPFCDWSRQVILARRAFYYITICLSLIWFNTVIFMV